MYGKNIHSKNLFIQKNPKLFIQRIYSFKKIQNYSFKEYIHSSEKWIIAQGYSPSPNNLITSPIWPEDAFIRDATQDNFEQG